MTENTVIDFARPTDFSPDLLTDVLRQGARELLATAVRAEVSEFIASHANLLDDEGRQPLVRHGFLPEREVLTGIGNVAVQLFVGAALSAQGQIRRRASALVVSEGHLDGRLQRGTGFACGVIPPKISSVQK